MSKTLVCVLNPSHLYVFQVVITPQVNQIQVDNMAKYAV